MLFKSKAGEWRNRRLNEGAKEKKISFNASETAKIFSAINYRAA